MQLFGRIKKNILNESNSIDVLAPISGEIVNIEQVPDIVFSEKMVGDGVAIMPTGNKIVAPFNGKIVRIYGNNHAFAIESNSGIEMFIHFGIDTVELQGEGFTRIAEEGEQVKIGDTIIEINLPLLQYRTKSTLTPIVISNIDAIATVIKMSGVCEAGRTVIMRVKK